MSSQYPILLTTMTGLALLANTGCSTLNIDKKAIWSDTNAKSDGSAGHVSSVMGVHSQEALDQQTVQASKTAYQALSTRAKKE